MQTRKGKACQQKGGRTKLRTRTDPPNTGRLRDGKDQGRRGISSSWNEDTHVELCDRPPGQKVRPGVSNSSEKTRSQVSPVWVTIVCWPSGEIWSDASCLSEDMSLRARKHPGACRRRRGQSLQAGAVRVRLSKTVTRMETRHALPMTTGAWPLALTPPRLMGAFKASGRPIG